MKTLPHILDLDYEELSDKLESWEEPKYRSKQIWEGLYNNLWNSPVQFTNLSKKLNNQLESEFTFNTLKPITVLNSIDNLTDKILFSLHDGELIESVIMRYQKRITFCISTQVGCGMGCVFCATGQMGFKRNLTVGEIVEQVLYLSRKLKSEDKKVTNIVIMGMGEPFHNYDATMTAIRKLNDPRGFNLGMRRFTVSTVGLIPEIKRFTKEKTQINLAISLHSIDDELRTSMLPINKKYPTKELLEVCKEYTEVTGRRITFEWALIDNVNDSEEDAHLFGKMISNINCHVNVIPLNPTSGFDGKKAETNNVKKFQLALEKMGVSCTIRVRRGKSVV